MKLDAVDPLLVGDRVAIRPIMAGDVVVFHAAEHTAAPLGMSRLAGRTLSLERYAESLNASVLVGMTVVSRVDGAPIGYGLCYDADFVSDRAKFAVMTLPEFRSSPLSMDGVELFLRYTFEHFPFRALYADVFDPNLAQFASAERAGLLERQGTFPEYQFWRGQYVAMHTFRISRERFEQYLLSRPAANAVEREAPGTFEEFASALQDEFALDELPGPDDTAGDLGLDSLAHAELAMWCSELFDAEVGDVGGLALGKLFETLRG